MKQLTVQRFKRVVRHPREVLAYHTKSFAAPVMQRVHRRLLERRVNLDFLEQRPPEGYPPDFSDLWFLYQTVRRRKPRVILEFGSGSTTVALAQAVADNLADDPHLESHVYSVDDQSFWADVTRRILPAHLRTVCDVLHVPAVEVELYGQHSWRHIALPDVVPDFVHLDGPTFTPDRIIAVDILDMEKKLPRDFYMVIDGRARNVWFLRKHLKRPFHFRDRIWYFNTIVTLKS